MLGGSVWWQLLAQIPPVAPDPDAIPGGAQAEQVVNGLAFFLILASIAISLAGGVAWASSGATRNPSMGSTGKSMVIGGVGAVFLVGAIYGVASWAIDLGSTVR